MEFFQTLFLTLKVASYATLILLPLGIALGYFLAFCNNKISILVEILVWMPLVLPPTVLGFYLLLAFSPSSFLGAFLLDFFNIKLVFSFWGVVLASVIFSLPFMVNPIKDGLINLPKSLKEASYTLGAGKLKTLFYILLPNIKSNLALGIITSFIHTIGEFGVVMMIGGSIAGETKLASIAIYEEVEATNYALAHKYSLTLFLTTFVLLFIILFLTRKARNA